MFCFVTRASSKGWHQAAHLTHLIITVQCLATNYCKYHVQYNALFHTCQEELYSCYTYHIPGTGLTVASTSIVLQGDVIFVVKICVNMCISIHNHERMLQMYNTCHTWS